MPLRILAASYATDWGRELVTEGRSEAHLEREGGGAPAPARVHVVRDGAIGKGKRHAEERGERAGAEEMWEHAPRARLDEDEDGSAHREPEREEEAVLHRRPRLPGDGDPEGDGPA